MNFFTRPLFWLALYILTLVCFGLIYINSLGVADPLHLTAVTTSSADEVVTASVQGLGLNSLPAYLTLDASNRRAVVGNIPVAGYAADIEIVDDQAYVVSQLGGVSIFDLTSPLKPEMLDRWFTYGRGWRSSTDGKNLYYSSLKNGLLIYPASGSRVPHTIFESAFATVSRGQHVFIASGKAGLSIFEYLGEAEHPRKTRFLSHMSLPGFSLDLALSGSYLVVASRSGGLHLIDIDNIENPKRLQTISDQKTYERVWWVDNILFASDRDKQLDLFRFAEGHLKPCGSLPLVGRVRDYLQDRERLYLAESGFGVSLLDVSDPERPKRTGYVGTPGEAVGLALYGQYLYVANSSQGVQIVDTDLFAPINVLASFDTSGRANSLVLDERWIYIADGFGGLKVVDRSEENNLKLIASYPTEASATVIVKAGNIVYVAFNNKSLSGFDVSEPLKPKQVSQLKLNVSISDLAVRGTALFVSSYDGKLFKIDISDPVQPQVEESLDLPGKLRSISLAGDYVYIAAQNAGLLVAHFSSGQPGRLIGSLTRPWPMSDFSQAFGVTVLGRYAYLIQGEDGVQIVDISDPEKPVEVEFIPLPARGLSIGLSDSFVVVSTRWDGYYFLDISRPEKPFLAANVYLPRGSSEFKIGGNKLYTVSHASGINVVPLPIKSIGTNGYSDLDITFEQPQHPGWYDLNVSGGKKVVRAASVLKVE